MRRTANTSMSEILLSQEGDIYFDISYVPGLTIPFYVALHTIILQLVLRTQYSYSGFYLNTKKLYLFMAFLC